MKNRITLFAIAMIIIGAISGYGKAAIDSPSGQIDARAARLVDRKSGKTLVSNGIPFAPGQLFSEKNLAVLDAEGAEIPIAAKVLAKWPYDGSIRSLLVQFLIEMPRKYEKLTIKWGAPRSSSDIAFTEVGWDIPEGLILLPANWLCLTGVTGDQVPFGKQPFPAYDHNIEAYYPRIRDAALTGDASEDVYYDTPHVFYQLYVRTGDDDMYRSARRETLNYRGQIIMTGPERGRHRQSAKTRYIYVQAMIDDYLLTGDQKSLIAAGYMAEYLKAHFEPSEAFYPRDASRFWTEREAAFPFLGMISYYELTGDKDYLKASQEIMQNLYRTQNEWPGRGGFIHNLYSHDPEEGARRDEYGGSPFMTGLLLEAIVKYHQLTNSDIAKKSIFIALDWLMKEGLSPDGNSVIYMTSDKSKNSSHPDLNMLVVHAFGYGYMISGYERKDYLAAGNRLFENGVKEATLSDRKHFNQNYRSSGHYLSYINRP